MQSTFENQIVKLDLQRFFLPLIAFALISIFMHLLLHNYDRLKENNNEIINYTSTLSALPILPEKVENKVNKVADNLKATIKKPLPRIVSSKEISLLKPADFKKFGNATIFSIKRRTNLLEILQLGLYKDINLIGKVLNQKKQNFSLKTGDLLQIIENTKNSKLPLKIILNNSKMIILKKLDKNYQIILAKQEDKKTKFLKKPQIITQAVTYKDLLNKYYKIPNNVKLDLLKLHALLKKGGQAPYKYLIAYSATRDSKLLFLNVETSKGCKKIYKFKDRGGNINFVEADGSLILNFKPSLKDFNLAYPIANPVIGSGFGIRKHPVLGCNKMHKGLDFPARRGTPIYAPADGIIVDITNSKGFGKNIRIRHNNIYTTLYGHLDAFAQKPVGTKIHKGEVIGFVGKTGLTSGEHLHFELHENGRPINPMKMIAIHQKVRSTKLTGKDLKNFKSYTNKIDSDLQKL
jgi:murein DD-endopeptidase MepM/ murein hydrolase activator NlpD